MNHSRCSSISSTGTGGSTGTEGDETVQVDINDPAITRFYEELNDAKNAQREVLVKIHRPYMETRNKRRYAKRTIQATKAALEFVDHIENTFAEVDKREDGAHQSILDNLARLNPDLITNIYIGLNKRFKKSKEKGKGKDKATARANSEVLASSPPREGESANLSIRQTKSLRHNERRYVISDSEDDRADDGNVTPNPSKLPKPPKINRLLRAGASTGPFLQTSLRECRS